jgi:hypothetical protein
MAQPLLKIIMFRQILNTKKRDLGVPYANELASLN